MARVWALLAVLLVLCSVGGGVFATMPSVAAQERNPNLLRLRRVRPLSPP